MRLSQPSNISPPPAQLTHTVVAGDTLGAVAQQYGVSLADLLRWVDIAAANRLEDVNLIHVGQKLVIPAQGVARGR